MRMHQSEEAVLNAHKPSRTAANRFYEAAWADAGEAGWQVMLDGRPVHTPQRSRQVLPSRPLAEAIAAEWDAQGGEINPTAMPLTRLANSAIDRAAPRREEVISGIVAYGETDLLCYRAQWPQKLVALQAQSWDPILAWLAQTLGAELTVVAGIMHTPQPPEAIAALTQAVRAYDDFALTAMNQMTTLTASLVLTLAVARARLEAAEAWRTAHLDEDWQISQWGEEAAARQRREARWADMAAAARFLALSQNRE